MFWSKFVVFFSLYPPRSCLVLVPYNKTNTPCLFCLILKLFTLGNIIFKKAWNNSLTMINNSLTMISIRVRWHHVCLGMVCQNCVAHFVLVLMVLSLALSNFVKGPIRSNKMHQTVKFLLIWYFFEALPIIVQENRF